MEREPAKTFRDLIVWQKAHQLVLAVYRLSNDFPKTELYGLALQMKKSAVSVAANIAEGFRKNSKIDKVRFLNIAQGSLEETRYYLILAQDLDFCNTSSEMHLLEEVSKLLEAYAKGVPK